MSCLHILGINPLFSSVAQSCLTLQDPMNRSMPGLPVHHQLLEFTQTHVPWVGDAIRPSHPLLSPSSPAPNPSQHQGLFQWVNSLHDVAKAAQAGIKIGGRNINNLRYADDTTLMADSEEELKSLLMEVKVEREKVGLKLNTQKMKIMASGPITSWEIDGETVADCILGGLQNHYRWWLQPWN